MLKQPIGGLSSKLQISEICPSLLNNRSGKDTLGSTRIPGTNQPVMGKPVAHLDSLLTESIIRTA